MNKEKWLLKEIDKWEQQSLISSETAVVLKDRYEPKKNVNLLVIIFSIIGTLLIGAGVILILAKNWYTLPLFLRIVLAFLPLVVSQALAVFVVMRRFGSTALRESAAILVTASVFAAIAIVGQVFHLSGDYGTYILTCGLLSLPMIYILNAAAPLIVYYWTILNWAALEQSYINALILCVLFAAGCGFVFVSRKQEGARLQYITWITVIAGFIGVLILGSIMESSFLLMVLCYFTVLVSVPELPCRLHVPFTAVGLTGALITLAVLTYEGMWDYPPDYVNVGVSLFAGVMLIVTLFFAIRVFQSDTLKFTFILSLILVCAVRYIWTVPAFGYQPYGFNFMIMSNLVLLFVGVGFIVQGVRHISLLTTNIGMVSVCALIVMRFFDSDMDFLWRGIVFLVLGITFLLVNLKILRKRKRPQTEVEQ